MIVRLVIIVLSYLQLSNCNELFDRSKAIELIDQLMRINTGYEKTTFYDVSKTTNEELSSLIQKQYVNLKCSYMYSSLLYIDAITDIIQNSKPRHRDTISELLFERHVTLMLATIHNSKSWTNQIGELWIVYMFVKKIGEYFTSTVGTQKEIKYNLMKVRDITNQHLKSLTLKHCDEKNAFNFHYGGSLFNENFEISKRPFFNKEFFTREHYINMNKYLMENQILSNVKCGLTFDNYEKFNMNTLYLNGIMVNERHLNQLEGMINIGIDLKDVFKKLRIQYEEATSEYWPDWQINKLANFHTDFINTMLVIMLRTLWEQSIYLCSFNLSNTFMTVITLPVSLNRIIVQFSSFYSIFKLPYNKYYIVIDGNFGDIVTNALFYKTNAVESIKIIEEWLQLISTNYEYCGITKPPSIEDSNKNSNDLIVQYYNKINNIGETPPTTDLSYWFDLSIFRMQYIVEFVKWILQGVDFDIINSFISMSKELAPISTNS
ncbi:uncharacterized protein LOC126907138 [Daktulosphaira vitifoliae]|uniref:uncharacterized protein LOC126907138 n=1 Tax=Daktulosphaira vitifoliae TaxID=58002 RepID=UPI0021A9D23F|nr:uncharacterized protein LOC126907138 [Daktulosphaira vitifoliae]